MWINYEGLCQRLRNQASFGDRRRTDQCGVRVYASSSGILPHLSITRPPRPISTDAPTEPGPPKPVHGAAHADIACTVAAAATGAVISALIFYLLQPQKLASYSDLWFQADINRVTNDLVNPGTSHTRANVHPFFVLLGAPPTLAVSRLFHLAPVQAAEYLMIALAGVWGALLYVLLRRSGSRPGHAVLFAGLGLLSSGNLLYSGIVETYVAGSISVIIALLAAASASGRRWSQTAFVAAGALSFGITVSNWVSAAAATLSCWPRRKAILLTLAGLGAGMALALLQAALFPDSLMFWRVGGERHFLRQINAGSMISAMEVALVGSIVLPQVWATAAGHLSVETLFPGSVAGALGAVAWALLLALGVKALVDMRERQPLRITVAVILAVNIALHSVYGDETALYSLHFIPALIVLASLVTQTRFRKVGLTLAGVTLACQAANNIPGIWHAIGLAGKVAGAGGF